MSLMTTRRPRDNRTRYRISLRRRVSPNDCRDDRWKQPVGTWEHTWELRSCVREARPSSSEWKAVPPSERLLDSPRCRNQLRVSVVKPIGLRPERQTELRKVTNSSFYETPLKMRVLVNCSCFQFSRFKFNTVIDSGCRRPGHFCQENRLSVKPLLLNRAVMLRDCLCVAEVSSWLFLLY